MPGARRAVPFGQLRSGVLGGVGGWGRWYLHSLTRPCIPAYSLSCPFVCLPGHWYPACLPACLRLLPQAVLLDLVWLLRQGDPYGSGVAAAALAQYADPEQVAFLSAVAAMPAVALLWSPHAYGQHSAARLLADLARSSPGMPDVLVEAGAVRGLLQQLDLR